MLYRADMEGFVWEGGNGKAGETGLCVWERQKRREKYEQS